MTNRLGILYFLFFLAQFRPETLNVSNQKQIENKARAEILMNKQFEQINFKNWEKNEFLIDNAEQNEIRCTIDVYWKQQKAYILPEVEQGSANYITVLEDNVKPRIKYTFYTKYGFKFNARKGKTYKLLIENEGSKEKLIILRVSKQILTDQQIMNKTTANKNQEQISQIIESLKNSIMFSQRNSVIRELSQKEILKNSNIYWAYQIIEIILIIASTFAQGIFFKRLLTTNSII